MPFQNTPISNIPQPRSFLEDSNRIVPRLPDLNSQMGQSSVTPETAAFLNNRTSTLQMLRYPTGVGVQEEYPHWLKIETHVRASNELLLSKYSANKTFEAPEAKQQRLDPNAANLRISTVLGAGVGGAAGNFVGKKIIDGLASRAAQLGSAALSTIGKTAIGGATTIGGAIIGGGTGLVAGALSGPNGYKTLTSVIGLALQDPISASYASTWQSQEIGEFLATGEISPMSIARETIRNTYGLRGAVPNAAGIEGNAVLGAQELASGKVRNPYKEQLFKGSEFRTFTFKFTLLPESIAEAEVILQIIKQLRSTMLPSLDPSGFYLTYPAEYTLTYMYMDTQNTKVNGIGTCVLTDLSTRYGGRDFVTFIPPSADMRGTPAEYALSMTFREIVPITANQVLEANL
jgi:hypothetical protein